MTTVYIPFVRILHTIRCFALLCLLGLFTAGLAAQTVYVATIDGAINPTTADYFHAVLERATEKNAECLILKLNTPGGLLKSTRSIVGDILEAKIPVIVFITPGGAQGASAGVFITLSGHLAAMSPGTNIGAASPVSLHGEMDSVMASKVTNDAAAFIRAISEKRKRNTAWAEDAVRHAVSITETEALDQEVIDLLARDVPDLLKKVDGMTVIVDDHDVVLRTASAAVERLDMSWTQKLFDILSDPDIAYILFLLGVFGLLFEIYNPGAILPGIVGVISLILAFYSFHTLPINYAGLALIFFAVVLFLIEIKVPSHGLLTTGGIASLILGAMMLIRTESALEVMDISLTVILASAVMTALFFTFVIGLGLRAQRNKPVSGPEGLVGETADALTALAPEGKVRVHGEIWKARAMGKPIEAGARVRISGIDNLTLLVEEHS